MISQRAWAEANPPRKGETREQYYARYDAYVAANTPHGVIPNIVEGVEQFGRGALTGVAQAGTSTLGGLGYLMGDYLGGKNLENWSQRAGENVEEYLDPRGAMGATGKLIGRLGGEVGSMMVGGAGIAKGLSAAGRIGKLGRAGKLATALAEGAKAGKFIPTVAVNAPIDVLQGASQEQGMVLPGRAGSIAENLLFSGAGAAYGARKAAKRTTQDALRAEEAQRAQQLINDQLSEEIANMPDWEKAMRLESEMFGDNPTDAEIMEFVARYLGKGKNLSQAEQQQVLQAANQLKQRQAAAVRRAAAPAVSQTAPAAGPVAPGKPRPKIRARSGAALMDVLAPTAGGAAGGLYGYATGETEEDRLARALAFGMGGAGLGYGGARFFGEGVAEAPSLTQQTNEAVQEAASSLRRGEVQPPIVTKKGTPSETFPDNRTPLVNRYNFSDPEKSIVMDYIGRVEPTITRPILSEKELYEGAAKILKNRTVQELQAIDPKKASAKETFAIMQASRDMIKTMSAKMGQLEKLGDADPELREQLIKEIEALGNTSQNLVASVMRSNSETGAALAALRFIAKDITNPTYWYLKASKAKGLGVLSQAERDMIDKLSKEGNPENLLKYMASLQKSSKLEQVAQIRSAGFLTALVGRGRDLLSTSSNYVSTAIQRYPGAMVDTYLANRVAKKLGGGPEEFRTMLAPEKDEFLAAFRGAGQGIEEAAKSIGYGKKNLSEWSQFIREAELDPESIRFLDVPSLINIDMFGNSRAGRAANAFADTYSKFIMRTAGLTDKVIGRAALNGALVEQAKLLAMRKGLKGEDAARFIQETVQNPPDEVALNAANIAKYITFTNDGTIADGISRFVNSFADRAGKQYPGMDSVVRAGMRFAMPFRRTPANILSRAIEYTPGVGTAWMYKNAMDWNRALVKAAAEGTSMTPQMRQQQRKVIELLTKNASGTAMFMLGTYLYKQGLMTGEAPKSPTEQEQWRLEGKTPESMLLFGQWVPIARISPFGGMMTMGASAVQNSEAGESVSGLDKTLGTMSRSILNQPMVTGPKAILEAATERSTSESPAADYLSEFVGSFVPVGLGQLARSEGVQRLPQTMGQQITSRIPGMQETTPMRLNVFGEPVQKPRGVFNVAINPLPFSPDVRSTDPLVRILSESKIAIPALPRKKKTGETMEMYQYRQRETGRILRQQLTELVQRPEFIQASPEDRQTMVTKLTRSIRAAHAQWLKENFNMNVPEEQQ